MSPRLIVADDSSTIQKVVELFLEPEGFQVMAAASGEEALGLVDSFSPNIIIADTEMSGITGYEVCERIKADPRTAQIPVIILYSAFDPFDEGRARASGADGTLAKPFESQDILDAVQSLLGPEAVTQGESGAVPEPQWDEEILVQPEEATARGGLDEEWEAWGLGEAAVTQPAGPMPCAGDEALKKAVTEELHGVIERVVRESLRETMDSMRGVIEETIRQGIPRVAEEIIRKEIERITSQKGQENPS